MRTPTEETAERRKLTNKHFQHFDSVQFLQKLGAASKNDK